LNSNYQQFARIASGKIHKISLACEQDKNLQDLRDFARASEQEILHA
jgi:hypothetical protein